MGPNKDSFFIREYNILFYGNQLKGGVENGRNEN